MKLTRISAILLSVPLVVLSVHASARPIKEQVRSASNVIVNRMTGPHPVPEWVLKGTKCVGALKVVKAGFLWGGQGSTGMVSCRTAANEWSEPSFFSVSGVTFGLQIGIQFLESVLVFQTDKAREILSHATFQLGTDLSAAAGPVGGGEGEGVMPNAQVLTYDKSTGLYVGATINGFVISHHRGWIKEAYGEHATVTTLLSTPGTNGPEIVQPFVSTMNQYMPTH